VMGESSAKRQCPAWEEVLAHSSLVPPPYPPSLWLLGRGLWGLCECAGAQDRLRGGAMA
jgi:hypothetical protein